MIKIKSNLVIGLSFLFITYVSTLYLNGDVNEGRQLYVFELAKGYTSYQSQSVVLGITLWLMPKLFVAYYLANTLFKDYKKTYAYYFVRSRDSEIWIKKEIFQLGLSVCLISFLKLGLAMFMNPSSLYIAMAILELLCMGFISLAIFNVLLLTNSEKISVFVIISVIAFAVLVSQFENAAIMDSVFMYHNAFISCTIILLLSIVSIVLMYWILKHKEFYY